MTTNNIMKQALESHNADVQARDLQTLLDLPTYQDMTDTEITKVIEYWVEQAKFDNESNARQASYIIESNERAEMYKLEAQQAQAALLRELAETVGSGTMEETEGADE